MISEVSSMNPKRMFKKITLMQAGIFLLLGLPVSGICQTDAAPAAEPAGVMEEVIVLGSKPLLELKLEMYKAEEVLYDIFNSFNGDNDLDVHCYKEAPVGSHIKRRICKTNLYRKLLRRASQRMMAGEHYVYPVAEIKHLNERVLDHMTKTALEQPEMMDALIRANEAREALESERKRRCEDVLLFCW